MLFILSPLVRFKASAWQARIKPCIHSIQYPLQSTRDVRTQLRRFSKIHLIEPLFRNAPSPYLSPRSIGSGCLYLESSRNDASQKKGLHSGAASVFFKASRAIRGNVSTLFREAGRRQQRAFALVELMVVILTLAVLAALVAPALARSDDDSKRMVCVNNLRQLGMAANMYPADNDDYLAFCNWGFTPWPGWLYAGANNKMPNPNNDTWHTNPIGAWETGLWFKYVQKTNAYLCPVDIESPTFTKNQRFNELSGYVMNGAQAGFGHGNIRSKVTDVWNSDCWLVWEPDENALGPGNPGALQFADGANQPTGPTSAIENVQNGQGPGALHDPKGSDILFVSGSVQFTTMQKIRAEEDATAGSTLGPGRKNLGWWSPFSSNGH
jgi:type II secretory pathway pseudopilin PulG